MKILAIETSCDETAVAILEVGSGLPRRGKASLGRFDVGKAKNPEFKLLSNVVLSQIKLHRPFGGVVPHLAQREHQKNLAPILKHALREINLSENSLAPRARGNNLLRAAHPHLEFSSKQISRISKQIKKILERESELLKKFEKEIFKITPPDDIDAIAVTYGPGLEPALWVGVNFAKALAVLWKKPLIAVNHLEGHIYASWLDGVPKFPLLSLIVSGGHTELVLMKKHLEYNVLGETRDDAAGEAFDKVAKMLGLGYPGGPGISKLALDRSPTSISFPRPMINSGDFDFSFSGLKTAVLYYLRDYPKANKNEIAYEFQEAVVDVLISKTEKALKKYKVKSLVVGGGVSANKKLRASLENLVSTKFPKISLFLSPLWLTGDNASMIAVVAYFKAKNKKFANPKNLKAEGNLKLG